MLNTAESAGEREAGGDPAHLSERRRSQLAMSKRWTEELEKGTTSRSNLTTAAPRKVQWSSGLTIRVGDMVRVAPCLGDGKVNPRHCHGGDGYVVSVTGDGQDTHVDVRYSKLASGVGTECGIPLSRITAIIDPFTDGRARPRRAAAAKAVTEKKRVDPPPAIVDALKCNRKRSKGWRLAQLGVQPRTEQYYVGLANDFACVKSVIDLVKDQSAAKKELKAAGVTVAKFCFAWRVTHKQALRVYNKVHRREAYDEAARKELLQRQLLRKKRKAKEGGEEGLGRKKMKGDSVLTDREFARSVYTPLFFFKQNFVDRKRAEVLHSGFGFGKSEKGEAEREAVTKWHALTPEARQPYKIMAASHDEKQPLILDTVVGLIKADTNKTYAHTSNELGAWCSGASIRRLFVKSGVRMYADIPIPNLSVDQLDQRRRFGEKVVKQFYGLPSRQPILDIHFDEKWFKGHVSRKNHKQCIELNIVETTATETKHKNHIPKVMVVAVTAYAFENGFEGGGDGLKIGFYRAQGVKMARRTVRAYNAVSRKYDGPLVRKKGDAYLVDCNVTGSSKGTEDNPKFSLKHVFKSQVFPAVEELVEEGGKYEGYLPIFRGDNAGPHKEKTKGGFDTFCAEYCEERGWRWEPQSAQSPEFNNNDLTVFPAMSKRHSVVLKKSSGRKVADKDTIFEKAKEVFDEYPSSAIARGHILAYRLIKKALEIDGRNDYIRNGLHCNVRQDFIDCDKGVRLRLKKDD